MNYDNLSDEEVQVQLKNHDEANWTDRTGREVIEPRDVLYWLDAFGDLSLAINCQGLPKDLPDRVIEAINEWDVLNDWQGKISEHTCPLCSRTLYEFDWKYSYLYVDENGDEHNYVQYLNEPAGRYWDTSEEHRVMCQACYESTPFHGWQDKPTSNTVRVFYGEDDTFCRFSHSQGIIRWDSDWDYTDKSTDLYNLRHDDGELIRGEDIAAAFAKGRSERNEMMERIGFERVHVKELGVTRRGVRRFYHYAQNVLEGWATIDSESKTNEATHPDMDFTYIIEGQHQAWVPSNCVEKFKAELIWQSLREAHDYEEANEWREDHDDVLQVGWTPA